MSQPGIAYQTALAYQHIIDTVIESTRQQFENAGKDVTVLEALRKAWIEKLNAKNVIETLPIVPLQNVAQTYAPQPGVATAHGAVAQSYRPQAAGAAMMQPRPGVPGVVRPAAQPTVGGILGAPVPGLPMTAVPGATTAAGYQQQQQKMQPGTLNAIAVDSRAGYGVLLPAQHAQQQQLLQQQYQQHQQQQQLQQQQQQAAQLKQEKLAKQRVRALDDEEIGSDDDDLDLDLGEDDPTANVPKNTLICLFEKITRVKNKRRVQLRDGLMKVNGREYIFARANGDFDW